VIDDLPVVDFPEGMQMPHLDSASQVQPFIVVKREYFQ
jgi:hypothetical protein